MKVRHGADDAMCRQFLQALDGEADVEVLLEARAVKICRAVAHHDLAWGDVARNDAVVRFIRQKDGVAAQVQRRGRQQGDPSLRQLWPRDPWPA